MRIDLKLFACAAALAGLAACAETESAATDNGLSGTPADFAAMAGPCTDQAARMTGVPAGDVSVTNSMQTGGGPLLTLDAGGAAYSCRREADGSVTVFSEFAN